MIRLPRLPMQHRPARALALAAALAACGATFAAESPADEASPAGIRPLAGVMVTGTLGTNTVGVTNPDGTVVTGNLSGRYEAFAGAEFPVDPNGLAIRLTVGLHVTGPFKGADTEHMTSVPFEATLWYPVSSKLRIDGGIRYAMRSRFSGAGRHTSDGLNATPALVMGLGYRLMPHVELDMRYVYERYEQSSGTDVEASHWGLGLTAIY